MTETNPLLMTEEEYQTSEKQRKEREKKLDLSQSRFSYVRGNTSIQQRKSIRQYNQAKIRHRKFLVKEKKQREKIVKKITKQRIKNIKRISRGIYNVAKAIPKQRYSETSRAALLSNLRRGAPAEQGNILNTPNIFLQKTDKRKKYSLL